jgi:hypothetical protein
MVKICCAYLMVISTAYGQNSKGFTIYGKLISLKDNTNIYLVHNVGEKADTLMFTQAKNEQFTFKGTLPFEGGAILFLLIL